MKYLVITQTFKALKCGILQVFA